MSTHKTTITLSMLWLGFLIAASRGWGANVREYVRTTTGHAPSTPPNLTVLPGGGGGNNAS